jgi:hypothetical protein
MRKALVPALVLALLAATATAGAVNTPGRTQVRAAPITDLALTHASTAFVVGATSRDCDHVEMWNPDRKGTWRFGRPRRCGDATSTGSGIWDLAAASKRVLWIQYTGGNIREWSLLTATTTRKTPRLLRFVARDVGAPPPIVLGQGVPEGIPYAVDRQVTFLGDDGATVFRWTAPTNVVGLDAGSSWGAGGARVAALLDDGSLVLLSGAGEVVRTLEFAPGSVRAFQLAGVGPVVQVGNEVERTGAFDDTALLPHGALMLGYRQGLVMYRLGRTVFTQSVRTGARNQLLPRFPTDRVLAALDNHGLAWATGRSVHWKCAVCVEFGS